MLATVARRVRARARLPRSLATIAAPASAGAAAGTAADPKATSTTLAAAAAAAAAFALALASERNTRTECAAAQKNDLDSTQWGAGYVSPTAARKDTTAGVAAPAPNEPMSAEKVSPGYGPHGGSKVALPLTPPRPDLPVYSLAKFREGKEDRVWVAMGGGVYDVTPFLDSHPGGSMRIMMVNGSDLGKYWDVYMLHARPHIRRLLEEYRVASLTDEDMQTVTKETAFDDYYTNDPKRPQHEDHGNLRVVSRAPWNSEPARISQLTDSFLTPNDLFFVRNHNAVPDIGADWRLEIEANPKIGVKESVSYSLEELRTKFKRHEVISALQCAGNRQEDYVTEDRPLYVAPHWRNGAIGCARWAGVRVRDLLEDAGVKVDDIALGKASTNGVRIINFIAEDTDETGTPYAGVIPIEKGIDPWGDAILAYEMNGATLPRDHGYPVRLLAPGHAGCRNVKWVGKIVLSDAPSELDSGSRLDRHYSPDVSWDAHREHTALERCPEVLCNSGDVREETGPVIQTGPVTSIITSPPNFSKVSAASVLAAGGIGVKGVAWTGGGRGICRVEVSLDGGRHFEPAHLTRTLEQAEGKEPTCVNCPAPTPEMGMGRNYAWCQYKRFVKLPEGLADRLVQGEKVELELVCKAVDGDMNQQPEKMTDNWNVLGIAVNHWHRVNVTIDPSLRPGKEPAPPISPGPGQWFDSENNSWERD